MRRNLKNKNRRRASLARRPWILFVLAIIIAIAAAVYFIFFRPGTNGEVDTSDDSNGIIIKTSPKGVNNKQDDKTGTSPEEKTPVQYDGEDPNTLDEITGYISYLAVNDDHFSIRLTINQFLESPGTCTATFSLGSQTVVKTSPTLSDASTSTCEGFDIPLSELSSGDWDVSIAISADKKGTITGKVNIP